MTATTVHVPERRSRPSAPDGRETIRSHRSATTRGTGTVGRGPVPGLRVQRLPRVTAPTDASELEADAAARRIASGGVAGPITTTEGAAGTGVGAGRMAVGDEDRSVRAWLQRVVVGEDDDVVARALVGEDEGVLSRTTDRSTTATTVGTVTGATPRSEATIRNPGAGAPLSGSVRHRIEPGLGVGLGHVRVHTGSAAAEAAQSLQARAFTHGHDIFLGRDESPTDLSLMAHEATHVVQQGAAEPHVQRLAGFIRNELADLARHVPGYTFVTVVIGYDPVRGTRVERTGRALVQGFLELVPFGAVIFDRLDRMGIVDDVVGFVEARLRERDLSLARLERTIERAWDRMDFLRLDPFAFNLGVLRDEFGALWDDVVGFATSIVDGVMAFVKDAAIGLAADLLEERPTWVLFTKVIHHDPLRDEPVEPTTEEIITDFLVLIGRERELEQMRARGTLARTAAWLDTQLATFRGLIGRATALFAAAWEAIRPSNLANLIDDLRGLANRAIDLLTDVASFAATVAAQVLAYIKDALLAWLSSFAHEVPGFHLMTVLVGRDPFTGATVLRTPENLIRGFITLLPGGNAVYDRLAETGIVGEAAARIQGAVDALGISWELVTGIFRGIWDALGIEDLIDPIGAFTRIRDRFGEPIARLFAFVRVVVQEVLTLLLAAMRFPVDLIGSIISNAMQAFGDIRRDVVGFLINLLAGFRAGFTAFFANIAQHLLGGLVDWLFRGLRSAGIEPPTELSFRAILDLVMQVLGLTADFLWRKLGERIGPERVEQVRAAIDRLTGVWAFVREVSVRGPIAIWEYVQERLSGLWDLILDRARNWIVETIIGRATARLLSMLDPTGLMAVVNGFIAFFDAVKSAIEYLRDILAIVNEWTSTIAAVARGEIQAGAAKLEAALAQAIPVAIGFLAQQVGLGNVGEKLSEIIAGVRGLVERAIDWLLDRAMAAFQSILGALGLGGGPGEAEGAAEEPGVPLSDEQRRALFADVGAALQARTGRIQDLASSRAVLEEIHREFRPRGLAAITVDIPDATRPWAMQVVAHASPGEPIGMFAVDERMSLRDIQFRYGTTLQAWLNGQSVGVYRAGGRFDPNDHSAHAETWLLTELTSGLLQRHGTRGETNLLLVRITRSPCPECTSRIQRRLAQLVDVGYAVNLLVEVASVHRGHTEAGVEHFVRLLDLEAQGLTLRAFDILEVLDDLGFTDEEIASIRADADRVRAIERRVAQVNRILAAYGELRAGEVA
jgi:hypothetical protein